jgi:ribonuclease BN (tRNA processing enzyme)
VRLTVVGCSPAWPNPGGAQSGYLVESDGTRLLLDCGPGVLPRLRELDRGWPRLEAIVITHFHLDHWGDLVPWVWGTFFGLGHELERPELWVQPAGIEQLREFGRLLGTPNMFERAFSLREYEGDRAFSVGSISILPQRLPHYTLRTYGLRIESGRRTLAYSGDSAPSEQLVELARGADLFVCEATLADGDLDGEPRGHLSADEALAAFAASAAQRLLLTHRPDELTRPDGVEFAHDGLVLEV